MTAPLPPLPFLNVINGTAGNDTLIGTGGNDLISSGAGNDSLSGGAGDDTLASGAGTNRIDAGAGNDTILIDPAAQNTQSGSLFTPANGIDGGTGYDTIVFTAAASNYHVVQIIGGSGTTLQITDLTTGAQTLAVNVEHVLFANSDLFLTAAPSNMFFGSNLADQLTGTTGADSLYGYDGNDVLKGGRGNDWIEGGTGADKLYGGIGNDTILQDGSDRLLNGGGGNDTLVLTAATNVNLSARDQTLGDAAHTSGFENVDANAIATNLTLTGSFAGNQIRGGQGDDTIAGGRGADQVAGGLGNDTFVFTDIADSRAAHADTIADFTPGQDVIDLSAIDAIAGGGNDAFSFIGSAGFTAAGQLRYDPATGALQADVTGDGQADLQILLAGDPALTAGDLIL